MAEYLLHLPKEQTVTVSTVAVRRLIDCGSGDAALLYLCLAKANGAISSEALCRELRWEPSRLHAAEQVLATAGLIAPPQAPTAPAPLSFQERPSYSREDIAHKLEQDGTFSALL